MKKILTLISLVAVFILAACGQTTKTDGATTQTQAVAEEKSEVTLTNGKEEVKVKTKPKKIVVFDLGVADTIRELGFVDHIVGMPLKTLPKYLKDLPSSIQPTGSMVEPDIEAIAALEPDLIIASGRTIKYLDQLKEIAPTVIFSVDQKDYWNSVSKNIRLVASLFGKEAETKAEEEIKSLEASIKKVADVNEKSTNKTLTLMLNEGKMSAFGADSRFAFLYQSLKFKGTDAKIEDSRHGQEMSFETIKEINPDTIIILNRTLAIGGDNSNADTILSNALFKETNAVKNNRVIQLTSDLWYLSGGGLQSTKLMIEDVQKVLQ
ncbi:ABC transporter substrate-binding protein [uncultured Granulicatella sp.]|uniref:siderophore ABC transporter substrate-binding protein n=1 Tax=uncultured Granulicatella sp. TaxID=316089 RepID=UPI002635A12E|nr:ABC transporter substrate-binding protein [uncultured Granulicatella sp.]